MKGAFFMKEFVQGVRSVLPQNLIKDITIENMLSTFVQSFTKSIEAAHKPNEVKLIDEHGGDANDKLSEDAGLSGSTSTES